MRIWICLFLWVLIGAQCTQKNNQISNKPVVKVNNNILTLKEFSNKLAHRLRELDSLAAKDPLVNKRIREELLNTFIVRALMLDWADKNKITINDDETEAEINRIRSLYPDDLSFRRVLADENLSFADWQMNIKINLLEKKVSQEINKKIKLPSEDEMKSFYSENKDSFKKRERIYIHQIVAKDEARADFIRAELKKSPFADLAKKYSLGPEGSKGGVVGWIEKSTVDFYDPLFKWPLNQVGENIKTPFGVLIVKVEKRQPEVTPPFADIKEKIQKRIIEIKEKSEYTSWLDLQLRSSQIFKDIDLINSIKIETHSQK